MATTEDRAEPPVPRSLDDTPERQLCHVCHGMPMMQPNHTCTACQNTGREMQWPPSTPYRDGREPCFICLLSPHFDPTLGADPECVFCSGRGVLWKEMGLLLRQFLYDHLPDIAAMAPGRSVDSALTTLIGQPLELALVANPQGIYTDIMPLRIYILPARSIGTGSLVGGRYDVIYQSKQEAIGAGVGRLVASHIVTIEWLRNWSASLLRHVPPDIWHPVPHREGV